MTESGTRVRDLTRIAYQGWSWSFSPTLSIVTGMPSANESGFMKPIDPGRM